MVIHKPPNEWDRPEMKISTIGLDLAKEIFQMHAVDERGKVVPKKKLKPEEMSTISRI